MKKRSIMAVFISLVLLLTGIAGASAEAPSMENRGFESGDLTGWTQTLPSGASILVVEDYVADEIFAGHVGPLYGPSHDRWFAVLRAPDPPNETILSQNITAAAGDTISGAAFFDAVGTSTDNDYAYVRIEQGGTLVETLFSANITTTGDWGETNWIPWSYTFTAAGTYTLVAGIANVNAFGFDSRLGLDLEQIVCAWKEFHFSLPGDYESHNYSASECVDLMIEVIDADGLYDDIVGIAVNGCNITTGLEQPDYAANVSLCAGDYEIVFTYLGSGIGATGGYSRYHVTENPYSGNYTFQCLNLPPVADAGPDQVVEQDSYDGGNTTLNGSASYDPNGGSLTYDWEYMDSANVTHYVYDQVAWSHVFELGSTVVTLTVTDDWGATDTDDVTIEVIDTTPPDVSYAEAENPKGATKPPAKPNAPQNPDGFYELSAIDICDPAPTIYVRDTGSLTVFGPFDSGVKIKYTIAPGAPPEIKLMGSGKGNARADNIDWHILGNGSAEIIAVDRSGNSSTIPLE